MGKKGTKKNLLTVYTSYSLTLSPNRRLWFENNVAKYLHVLSKRLFDAPYVITALPSLSTEKVVFAVPAGKFSVLVLWQDCGRIKIIKILYSYSSS